MSEIEGSSVLLLGYGREGRSTHQYLHAHHPDLEVCIADRNPDIEPFFPVEKVQVGPNYLSNLSGFDVIVRTPGIPTKTPELTQAVAKGAKLTSEMNIFFSDCPGVIVGVTGTKGKSTTSSLIASILSEQYFDVRLVGNIGKPSLDYLAGANEDTVFVAELSSYQLEDIHYSPKYATILGIKPEHLDHHGGFDEYAKAKQNIIRHQSAADYVVYNADNDTATSLVTSAKSHKVAFSTTSNASSTFIKDGVIVCKEGQEEVTIMPAAEIPLLGKGNIANVLAAITMGRLFGISASAISRAVREFKSLPHRLQYVGEKNDIRFFDDSLATIPEATINALDALGNDVDTLIAGGFDRGISFSELGKYLAGCGLRNLILFPTTGSRIWEEVQKHQAGVVLPRKFDVTTMQEAVALALAHTMAGKICLMSPASPSFGTFKDYADRGDQFKNQLVL